MIDGKVAWIGGAGIEDHFENGGFHDVMVRVTGNVVRQAQSVFLMSFRAQGGPLPADLSKYFPAQPDPARPRSRCSRPCPAGGCRRRRRSGELIDHASTRLDLMNPYFTDADMIQRVIAAARRGVKVRIVVSQTSNNAQATAALKYHYGDLIHAGVQIWEYPGAVVHAKLVVADDTVVFGTVNFDAWSLYRNYEVAMMARSAAAAKLSRIASSLPTSRVRFPGLRRTVRDALQGLVLGQARLLPLAAGAGRSRRTAAATAAPRESDGGHDREPDAPAGAAPEHRLVVHDVVDRRARHDGGAADDEHDAEPRSPRQRADAGERDQREDDHEPAVVRAFDPVERDRPGAAPGAEHADDREHAAARQPQATRRSAGSPGSAIPTRSAVATFPMLAAAHAECGVVATTAFLARVTRYGPAVQ